MRLVQNSSTVSDFKAITVVPLGAKRGRKTKLLLKSDQSSLSTIIARSKLQARI